MGSTTKNPLETLFTVSFILMRKDDHQTVGLKERSSFISAPFYIFISEKEI
jgi:hypothetical protein